MVAGAEIGGADKGGRKRRSGTENTCSREEGELDSRKGFVPTGGVGRRAKSVDGRKQTKTPPKQPGPAPPAAGFGVWTVVIVAMVLAAVLMLMPGREGSCGSSPSNAGENLKHREDAFQREVDEALQQSRERKGRAGGDAGEDANKAAVGGSVLIARDIVLEVLRRRERQLVKGTIKRAVTFHFAGDGKSTHPSMMARAVENFVLGNFKVHIRLCIVGVCVCVYIHVHVCACEQIYACMHIICTAHAVFIYSRMCASVRACVRESAEEQISGVYNPLTA